MEERFGFFLVVPGVASRESWCHVGDPWGGVPGIMMLFWWSLGWRPGNHGVMLVVPGVASRESSGYVGGPWGGVPGIMVLCWWFLGWRPENHRVDSGADSGKSH